MNFFIFNSADNTLEIDEYSILLVKEFKDLWDINRNKCKEDKSGKLRLRARKEITYIYLVFTKLLSTLRSFISEPFITT